MSDILRWNEVKTRKPHRCWGCAKTYEPGTLMVSAAYADSGSVSGCYWCKTCLEYMDRHFELGDEIEEGGIYENDPEGWEAIKDARRQGE